MMVKPGITTLDKCVDSRYTLVTMAAKRARMIGKAQHDGEVDSTKIKPVTEAVSEIARGKVGYVRSEAIHKAQEWEFEKLAAIQHMTEAAEHAREEERLENAEAEAEQDEDAAAEETQTEDDMTGEAESEEEGI